MMRVARQRRNGVDGGTAQSSPARSVNSRSIRLSGDAGWLAPARWDCSSNDYEEPWAVAPLPRYMINYSGAK